MKLSSILVVKNEENHIANCLNSLSACIDDIVVLVDSQSDDATLDIVKGFENVNYEVTEWKGYAETKRYALSKTINDWVFWIDGDEVLTKELIDELNDFKNSTPEHITYKVARRAYFLGKWIKHGGWYPGYVERLFNKNDCYFNQNKVHENLEYNGTVGILKNDLEHYTDPNIFHYYEKFNKYTSLAAEELAGEKRKAGLNTLLLRPLFFFVKMYILKLGFLDGVQGLMLAIFSTNYVFTKYCKLWEINKSNMK